MKYEVVMHVKSIQSFHVDAESEEEAYEIALNEVLEVGDEPVHEEGYSVFEVGE